MQHEIKVKYVIKIQYIEQGIMTLILKTFMRIKIKTFLRLRRGIIGT